MKKRNVEVTVAVGLVAMVWTASGQDADGQKPASLAPIVVQDARQMQEETAIGPYAQPEWTTHRRFPVSRVYVQHQPYEMGVEQWWRLRHFRDGTTEQRFQEEFGIGLPGRVQVDLYESWKVLNDGNTRQDEISVELRHALADWGRLPGNPTIYLEWVFAEDAADAIEAKLLLGDELAAGVHWAVNLVCEQQVGDERTTEYVVSGAFGRTIIDQKLGVGLEAKYASESEKDERSDASQEVMAGPSLQWRPVPRWHVDVAPLVGLTDDSPRLEAWVVAGFEFGPESEKKKVQAPLSTIRN